MLIQKAGGGEEKFNKNKIIQSLVHIGATPKEARDITDQAISCNDLSTTTKIHACVLSILKATKPSLSFRYNLKEALADLGPTGYPFEKFVAHIYTRLGFTTKTGVYMKGLCVQHEVDVYGEKAEERLLVECKFRNESHSKVDVRVPLYVKARFDDIVEGTTHRERFRFKKVIATNAKFTKDAITYASCKDLHLLGWSYPGTDNINTLIDTHLLYPVTALTTLTPEQHKILVQHKVVLAQEILFAPQVLKHLKLRVKEQRELLRDIEELVRWRKEV